MKRGQGVPLALCVGFLALSVFALVPHLERTFAIEIKPDHPISRLQDDLNEAAKGLGVDPLYSTLPAGRNETPDGTRNVDVPREAVGTLVSGDGATELPPELLLLLLGSGLLVVSGAAWWRHRRR